MAKLQCDTCGALDHVLFEGYAFGDTLLEGVMFEARLTGKTNIETGSPEFDVKVAEGHEAHWNKLNQKYWLEQAVEYVTGLDIAECPTCHDEVVMPGFEPDDDSDDADEEETSVDGTNGVLKNTRGN